MSVRKSAGATFLGATMAFEEDAIFRVIFIVILILLLLLFCYIVFFLLMDII